MPLPKITKLITPTSQLNTLKFMDKENIFIPVCEQESAINTSYTYQNSPDTHSPLAKPIRIKVNGYARVSNANSTHSFQTSKESISNIREIKNPMLKARFLNSKAGKPPQVPLLNKKFESD